MSTLLRVCDLDVELKTEAGTVKAANGVTFDVPVNSTVALVGESGSGKSVTALAILGLLPPNAMPPGGRIEFEGQDLLSAPHAASRSLRGSRIAMIFQEPMSSLNPVFSVGFQIEEVLRTHLRLGAKAARARAIELLHEVGIPDPKYRIDAYPHQLSGGQQQRVMIAMAMACEPQLLIADEPTTALDVTVQKRILELIAGLQRSHRMSMLFISHDLAVVGEIADSVVVMHAGEVRERGDVNKVFESPRDPYTKALLACRPPLAGRPAKLPVIADFINGPPAGNALAQRSRGVSAGDEIALEARHVTKSFFFSEGFFGKREVKAVKDVSFQLARGKTLGVVGESGSGKSTLAFTLMRLHEATAGEARFDGKDLFSLKPKALMEVKRRIQIVFQNPYASLNPRFTAGEILLEPMRIHAIGKDDNARRSMAFELLDRVGLPASAFFKYPHEFSGGQRQRIAIARCLSLKPEILICDESVSALDVSIQAQLLNLLQELQDEFRMSYLFISHDLSVVRYMADQIMVMSEGEVVEIGDSDEILMNPQHPYTQNLLASMPRGLQGRSA